MKGKYLNPKADLTFKKVFGEHPDLVMSLLNALLPLDEGKQIEHVEYLTPEMVPDNPGKKNSIVDVRCRETGGRHFIVEIIVVLQPTQSINLIIDGYHCVTIKLVKLSAESIAERKMTVLWLRFLTEIDKDTEEAPAELLENPETSKALKILEKSAYNEAQLYAYERFWDAVTTERVAVESSYKKGRDERTLEIARNMKASGLPAEIIVSTTGLTTDEIDRL